MYVIRINKFTGGQKVIYMPLKGMYIGYQERYEHRPTHTLLIKWRPRACVWGPPVEANWEEIKIPSQPGCKALVRTAPSGEQSLTQSAHLSHFSLSFSISSSSARE